MGNIIKLDPKYHLYGYLTDGFGNIIKREIYGESRAKSFAKARNNIVYHAKKDLGLMPDAKIEFKQTAEQKKKSWVSV